MATGLLLFGFSGLILYVIFLALRDDDETPVLTNKPAASEDTETKD